MVDLERLTSERCRPIRANILFFLVILLSILSPGAAGFLHAQSALPDGPGKATVERMCTQCHGINVVTPLRMNKERWTAKVDDMVSRGAQGSNKDVEDVIDYLARNFGKDSLAGTPVPTASAENAAQANVGGQNSSAHSAQPAMVAEPGLDEDGAIEHKITSGITNDDILHADKQPQNWITFHGTYSDTHYSLLKQITPENASHLELKWVFQSRSNEIYETTPIVVNGVLYTTVGGGSLVVALDAQTGRLFWIYRHLVSPLVRGCCGQVNRGLAILGDTLYLGAADDHLIALDAKTGEQLWDKTLANPGAGYSLTGAPLIVKDKVIIGISGGEYGIRGFIAAYNAFTGKEEWKFYTTAGPGDPGSSSWADDSWQHGGGPAWLTGAYDPKANLLYWGVGNPGPDYNGDVRLGDNLYTCSMLALDPDTGKLKWYYQANPHNEFDWDAIETPVLVDMDWKGEPRKLLLWADRNGFFYVLDRLTGEFLLAKAFIDKQNWNAGFDQKGRPIMTPNAQSSSNGILIYPDNQGATNWYNPSFSPRTGLFYLNARENYSSLFVKGEESYEEGLSYNGRGHLAGRPAPPLVGANQDKFIAVRALDPKTGERKWEYRLNQGNDLSTFRNWSTDTGAAGILTTASDVLFTGERQGHFIVLDARTGKLLWSTQLGGPLLMDPMTYAVDGKQYVAVNAGTSLFVFGLRQ